MKIHRPKQTCQQVAVTFLLGLAILPQLASAQEGNAPAPFSDASAPVSVGVGGRIVREDPYQTRSEKENPFHVHSLWESRYVSEGRDNLDGESLLSASTDFSFGPFTFAPWFAYGPESDYTELNLSLIAGTNIGEDFELYGGYTHLRSPKLNAYDNEIGAGAVYSGLGFVDIGGDWYHSFEAEGSFFEIAATREFSLTDRLAVSPFALLGFNAGYIPEGHDGANHVTFGVDTKLALTDRIEFTGFAGYNIAIDSDPARYPEDDLLKDFFWAAAGVVISF